MTEKKTPKPISPQMKKVMEDDDKAEARDVRQAHPLNARDDPDWWKERDKRRRERYKNDPTYREQQVARSRATYRAKTKSAPFDPAENLSKIDEFGKVRDVNWPTGTVVRRWCMTQHEMASVMGKSSKLFYQWVSDGRFPASILTAVDFSIKRDYSKAKEVKVPQTVAVYTSEEVVAAVKALAPHLSTVAYYRKDHVEEIEKVTAAVHRARAAIGLKS